MIEKAKFVFDFRKSLYKISLNLIIELLNWLFISLLRIT